MAFSDPSSIKVGATATPVSRVFTGTKTGMLVSEQGNVRISIKPGNPTKGGTRNELLVRLTQQATVDPTVNGQVGMSVLISVQKPLSGLTDAEVVTFVKNSFEFLTAGTDANLKKLISGEN